jgi:hypothetical protein
MHHSTIAHSLRMHCAMPNSCETEFVFLSCSVRSFPNTHRLLFASCCGCRDRYRAASGARPLDFVVVTAGMATTQGYTPNEEGLDQKLAVHYFGRIAFIQELLPLMRGAPDARVLSVLSGGIHSAYADYEKHFDLRENYSLKNAADAAGACEFRVSLRIHAHFTAMPAFHHIAVCCFSDFYSISSPI